MVHGSLSWTWWVTLVVWNFNYHWIQFHENIYFTIDYWLCFRYADADKNKHAFYCSETILNIIRMMAEDNLNNLTNSFPFHCSVQSVWGLPAHTNTNQMSGYSFHSPWGEWWRNQRQHNQPSSDDAIVLYLLMSPNMWKLLEHQTLNTL